LDNFAAAFTANIADGLAAIGVIYVAVNFDSKLRAGMTASRLYHRGRVIPALTDHLEDKGGVIGAASSAPRSNVVNRS
jgi:hypothetical protein